MLLPGELFWQLSSAVGARGLSLCRNSLRNHTITKGGKDLEDHRVQPLTNSLLPRSACCFWLEGHKRHCRALGFGSGWLLVLEERCQGSRQPRKELLLAWFTASTSWGAWGAPGMAGGWEHPSGVTWAVRTWSCHFQTLQSSPLHTIKLITLMIAQTGREKKKLLHFLVLLTASFCCSFFF